MSLLATFHNAESVQPPCQFAAEWQPAPHSRRGELHCPIDGRDVRIVWELAGRTDAPLLIVAGGINEGSHVCSNDLDVAAGWWQAHAALLGRYRVLAIDWLENGSTAAQADAIAAVCKALGLPPARAFIGASYGALVGLQFAARHVRLAERVIAISGAHSLCAQQWGKVGIGIADHALCPETIAVPLSVIAVEGDTLAPAKTLAELAVRAPNAWLQKIASAHGHAAYLKETTAIAAAINTALDD
ncbi:hypothetical protein CO615_06505 [Lysobacteraceae bacterium NML75-0749]|nr:hypothetical protein CO615_06505 [Xanthomonadaceae bacterium NML75-0749]PJK06000.1 hypothetical protein CO609_03485 [Xanthomonadaceae bacterium NML91-0268]